MKSPQLTRRGVTPYPTPSTDSSWLSRLGRSTPSVHPGGSLAARSGRSCARFHLPALRAASRLIGYHLVFRGSWLPTRPLATCHTAQDFAVPEPIGRTVNAARSVNFDYPLFGILLRLMICGHGHVLLICQRDRKCAAFAHAQSGRVTRTLARGAGSVHSCSPICRIMQMTWSLARAESHRRNPVLKDNDKVYV